MVTIRVAGDTVIFEVQGLDKLWAMKSSLEIPVENIRGVRADASIAKGWWKGLRLPGTHIPGVIIAGTFYQDGKRIFWDVKSPEKTIVIDLADDRYDQLIVEVESPEEAVRMIDETMATKET